MGSLRIKKEIVKGVVYVYMLICDAYICLWMRAHVYYCAFSTLYAV